MSDHKFDVMGIGNPIMDVLALVDEAFIEGIDGAKGGMELVDDAVIDQLLAGVSDLTEVPGGSAANTVFALARAGLSCTYLGKVGNDARSQAYQAAFAAWGGDGSRFKKGEVPNALCLSLVTPDAERTMRTYLGAAMTFAPDEVLASDFEDCRHLHIEGYLLFNRDLIGRILDLAKAAGCTVSLDLSSFEVVGASRDIIEDLLRDYVDLVFANEEEAAALVEGKGLPSHEEQVEYLGSLVDLAVVKLGKDGSLIRQDGETIVVPGVAAPDLIDTTAAGDLWATGFLHGWLRGKPLSECGRQGSLLGAEVVQVMGSVIEQERWSSVMKHFA